jgi:hypothetical protein
VLADPTRQSLRLRYRQRQPMPNGADSSARPLVVFRAAETVLARRQTLATVLLEIDQTFNPASIRQERGLLLGTQPLHRFSKVARLFQLSEANHERDVDLAALTSGLGQHGPVRVNKSGIIK